MANIWQMWQVFSKCLETVSQMLGNYFANIWQLFGQCGNYMATVWQMWLLFGKSFNCLANVTNVKEGAYGRKSSMKQPIIRLIVGIIS